MNLIFITLDELKKLHSTAALVVARFGDTYLPIFKRVHQELERHQEEEKLKAIALRIALE